MIREKTKSEVSMKTTILISSNGMFIADIPYTAQTFLMYRDSLVKPTHDKWSYTGVNPTNGISYTVRAI